jgi:hypothetical protein
MSSSHFERCGACVLSFLALTAAFSPSAVAQDAALYAAARTPLRTVDETALPWLERLERGATLLRDDARIAHFAVIGRAFVVAGDPRAALESAATAPAPAWRAFVRASLEDRLAAGDESTAIALCHVLARVRAPDEAASRGELSRALALVGRTQEALEVCAGDADLRAEVPFHALEGRVRRGAIDDALAAHAELSELRPESALELVSLLGRRALDVGRCDAAAALVERIESTDAALLGRLAAALWRAGRRDEAPSRLSVERVGSGAVLAFASEVDVPSDVLEALAQRLPRKDLDGRTAVGRRVASALAREGDSDAAWSRATQLGAFGAHERFELARDLEQGGDEGRATTLASSDPWSGALLELWRAGHGRGDVSNSEARALSLVRGDVERTLELCRLLLDLGRREAAGALAIAAIGDSPAALPWPQLVELVRYDFAATSGVNATHLFDALVSPAARVLLAAAAVEACLVGAPAS